MEFKICNDCSLEKPIAEFYKHGKRGFQSSCKQCKSTYDKQHYIKNKKIYIKRAVEYRKKPKYLEYKVKKFGISYNEYQILLKNQNYLCAICKQQNKNGDRLCIDHCHISNKMRGLLCHDCNKGLGFFKDKISNLKNSILYLENFT